MENNALVSEVQLELGGEVGDTIVLENNTFVGSVNIECAVSESQTTWQIFAHRNIFHAADAFCFIDEFSEDQRNHFRWQGGDNRFPLSIVIGIDQDDELTVLAATLNDLRDQIEFNDTTSRQATSEDGIRDSQLDRQREEGDLRPSQLRNPAQGKDEDTIGAIQSRFPSAQ